MKIRIHRVPSMALISLLSFLTLAAQTIAQSLPTTTSLSVISAGAPVTSVASGSVIQLTATVKSAGVAATVGQVNFCDASAGNCTDIHLLGTAQLTNTGTASLKFIPGIGSHNYKAVFAGTPDGSSKYAGSVSSAMALSVTAILPSTTTIAASGNPGNYTLTSSVTAAGSAVPLAGTVSFLDTSNANLSLGMATLVPGMPELNFLNSSTPPAGDLAWSVAVGDFNGDGIPDVVVANYGGDSVSVLLGKGDGTFTPAPNSPFTVTYDPLSIVVADFNGDGKLDLAMENGYYNGVVSIFLGNGDGTFTPAANSPITVGGPFFTPGAVAAGDFNGDGIPDLVAMNDNNITSQPGTMTVLLGRGDGTFAPTANSPLAAGSAPISIAVGDFNGDGISDLAVANFAGNNVTILLGVGNGTFTSAKNSPIAVGSFPTAIAAGDFNGDGILDLAVTNSEYTSSSTGSVSVLLGNGDGTFKAATNSPITVGGDPWSVAVGDFNGDGKLDLVVVNNSDDTVTILLGSGNGEFTQASISPVGMGDFPQSAAVGDFNGDGVSDMAVANSGSSNTTVLLSHLTQTATTMVSGISAIGSGPHLVEASYAGAADYAGSISQTVSLVGSSFTVAGSAVSLGPGATTGNTSTITVSPTGGFTGSVVMTAAVTASPAGAQNLPTFSFAATSPVSISGASAATATLTIFTTAATSAALLVPQNSGIRWYAAAVSALGFLFLVSMPAPGRSARIRIALLIFLMALTAGLSACGGSGGGGGGGNPGTTPGAYTITVTGTSGTAAATNTVTLTVQ
jgi:hypothetical protein